MGDAQLIDKEERLYELFSGERQLPTLPVLFYELSKLVSSSSTSVKKLSNVIGRDQAMVAKILKLCNSALYYHVQEVGDLTSAISYLGVDTLRQLILQVSLVRMFRLVDSRIADFDVTIFWEHSISTAYFSQLLAGKLGLPANENYYLAGLLHDIGKLALCQFFPKQFFQSVAKQTSEKKVDYQAESEVLGVNHTDVGAFLAKKWRFKEEIIAAIQYHHQPLRSDADLALVLVRVANLFSKAAGFCFSWEDQVLDIIDDPGWRVLSSFQTPPADISKLTFAILGEVDKIRESVAELLTRKG